MHDFRSDTVTRPTRGMLDAMASAPLGDDVLDGDPTAIALEERVAAMLGKELAVFVPSGTMSNLIAIYLHCQPGDELLCDQNAHLYFYEQAGYAQINGVSVRTVECERGIFTPEQLTGMLRPQNLHYPKTCAVAVENTHNRGGGAVWPLENLVAVTDAARQHGLTTHLDGARLFNAVVALATPDNRDAVLKKIAAQFDTVSLCFSKGLGTPAGSILVGSASWMKRARRRRKVLGGGMRQVGVLAAAALYALDNHIDRLTEDHKNAQRLADAVELLGKDLARLKYQRTETNMVFIEILSSRLIEEAASLTTTPAELFCQKLATNSGVRMLPTAAQTVRAVTYLDLNRAAIDDAIKAMRRILTVD